MDIPYNWVNTTRLWNSPNQISSVRRLESQII